MHIKTRSIQTGNVPAELAGQPIVNVWYDGHSIGLYRVNKVKVEERVIVLNHGAISFPVGTLLDVVDFQRLIPQAASSRLSTMVIENDPGGILLAW